MLKSVFAFLEQQTEMDVQGKLLQQQIYYLMREREQTSEQKQLRYKILTKDSEASQHVL